jgi:predicted Fe-Mo cluster-binding NifX family protein
MASASILVCVPVTTDGQVDARWGRAARVAVARVRDGSLVSWQAFDVGWDGLHDLTTEGGHHARVARFLQDQQVEMVVADHMGVEMAHMLERMGILVRLGAGGDARQAVLSAADAGRD